MGKVKLSPLELKIALLIGNTRRDYNRSKNIKDLKVCNKNGYDIDYEGALAEIAFAKLLNYCVDMEDAVTANSSDFTLRDGRTVDVKATRYKNGKLIGHVKKAQSNTDIYVLAVLLKDDEILLPGFLEKEELFSKNNLIDLGYGPVYGVTQDKLKPLSLLV